MNNEAFRRMLLEQEASKQHASPKPSSTRPDSTPSALGTKRHSLIPMTPRTVRGSTTTNPLDFARQFAAHNAAATSNNSSRKPKTSAAPKGVKLGAGYQDRTLERKDYGDDERGARILALEEQMKLGQLDLGTFEALRDQITGGDIGATHLVKGLDRKLLERVRRGEDVLGGERKEEEAEEVVDVDEEFEALEEKQVERVEREKSEKKGERAKPAVVAGAKRSRDQILAELKAQRKAEAEARMAARPELGSAFRDIGAKQKSGTRIERDDKGREVMITVDEHGNVKKKVRKVQDDAPKASAATDTVKTVRFLDEGITLPTLKEQKQEAAKEESEDEGDIFGDVGTDYNPLGDVPESDDDDDTSSDEDGQLEAKKAGKTDSTPPASKSPTSESRDKAAMPPPPLPQPKQEKPFVSRNYFKSSAPEPTEEVPQNPFNDANFLAAIKKASALSNVSFSIGESTDGEIDEEAKAAREAKLRKHAAMLANNDRDLEDMDMGFGSSRGGDDEDAEEGGSKVKLSEWKGTARGDDDDDEEGVRGGGEKKKRSRKRKGDKNSAKDVLGVLERRKESEK